MFVKVGFLLYIIHNYSSTQYLQLCYVIISTRFIQYLQRILSSYSVYLYTRKFPYFVISFQSFSVLRQALTSTHLNGSNYTMAQDEYITPFIEENLSSYKPYIRIRWLWENVSKQICQSKFYGSYQIDLIYFEEVSVWGAMVIIITLKIWFKYW